MMRNRIETAPREPEAEAQEPEGQAECCHYWIIDSPNGPISRGECKFCGTKRDFTNSPPEFVSSKRDTGNTRMPESPDKESKGKKNGSEAAPEQPYKTRLKGGRYGQLEA